MVNAFVPSYDIPTGLNARLARHVFKHGKNILEGKNATRVSLLTLIASTKIKALLVMSHGDENCLYDQNGHPAITMNDLRINTNNLTRLPIFAWACKTSLGLGSCFHLHSKKSGSGVWFGYRTTISAPSPQELYAFQELLNFIVEAFPNVKTPNDATRFLDDLRVICDAHYKRIALQMSRSRVYLGAHETAIAFSELWQHLDCWLPNSAQPVSAQFLSHIVEDI